MTRKRFVKLAMANGYSRNSANRIAEKVPSTGKSYAEVYAALLAVKKLSEALIPAIRKTMGRIAQSIGKMATAFSAGWEAFLERYSAAMTEE